MTHTLGLMLVEIYSVYTVMLSGVLGLGAGFLLRLAINAKQRKNIISLENEMLSNHSRILSLEKQLSSLDKGHGYEQPKKNIKKPELKVS